MNMLHRLIGMAAISAVAALAGGCATSNTPGDPLEGFNRGVFGFNEGVDQAIVKPIAKGYTAVVPEPATAGLAAVGLLLLRLRRR